jgi:hypothetical protein
MLCIQKAIHSWQEFHLVALNFLESDEHYLLLAKHFELQMKVMSCKEEALPELDLIQFCNLSLLDKGELGIREIHWKVSNLITSSRAVYVLLGILSKIPLNYIQKLQSRFASMQNRKRSVISLMKGFDSLGIAIPHYVEPRNTSLVMSRSFVQALLEFNPKGDLTFERAIFALARTANYKCVRISEFSHRRAEN